MGRVGKGVCGSGGSLRDNAGGSAAKPGRGRAGMGVGRVVPGCCTGTGCAGIGTDGSGRVGALAVCRTDSDTGIDVGNVGVADIASGTGFVVVGLVAGGEAVVTGAVGAAVLYSTGMCTGRSTVGGEGEGVRGGAFSVSCACGGACVSCVFWILVRGVGMKKWRP